MLDKPSDPITAPVTGLAEGRTIPDAFRARVRETPDAVAYLQYDTSEWHRLSWRDTGLKVARRQAAFALAGLQPGDRIGIFLPNCVDWIVTDIAAMAMGLITVPVYTRDGAANICHVLRDSGATLCVTDTADRWAALGPETETLIDLKTVWTLSATSGDDPRLSPCPEPPNGPEIDGPDITSDPDDTATLIYTSGTTGPPKGVMLSHRALLWNASAVAQVNPISSKDLFLSILPLAHAFERTLGFLCPMLSNAPVAFARSVETLSDDMQSLRPTIMLAVPRLFERARAKVMAQADKSMISRRLLAWTEAVGWQRRQAAEGKASAPSWMSQLFWRLAGRHVAARVRAGFGGRIAMLICGGAPLSAETARFLAAMELPLLQGYGLTEAGPAVTGTAVEDRDCDSVGYVLPGGELAIGDHGELLVRSPGLMLGYWNNPQATREVLDPDGWLHTGDVADIIDGRVYIRGRIKDILVLSTGENVNPGPIETALQADPLIEQVCVLGDSRPWCAAVVVVDGPAYAGWLSTICAGGDSAARHALTKRLAARLSGFPPYARIRDVVVETTPWDLESGLITPTLKAKRPRIAQRYATELAALYD